LDRYGTLYDVIFTPMSLAGAFVIEMEPHPDERGFFARTFCRREFEKRGLPGVIAQCNISFSLKAGTLRGMHFQRWPRSEAKVVRCVRGAIHDVIVDLRPDSRTYRHHIAVELTSENRKAVFVPELFAHGFQTLTDAAEVEYQISQFYDPPSAAGFRYDDPAFAIVWPRPITVISEQDIAWQPFIKCNK
jgi:dTDP-4-dehydrorhamnose 3,5-epimerase